MEYVKYFVPKELVNIDLVIIPSPVSETSPARLLKIREAAPGLKLTLVETKNVTPAVLRNCEALYGCPPPEFLREAPGLMWHHLPNSGIEPYGDLSLYANRAVTLTNARGVYGKAIAEHALGMALALLRQFPYYLRQQTEGGWKRHPVMRELSGSAVLICGMGDLGRSAAALFGAVGCTVLGVRRLAHEIPPGFADVYSLRHLHDALPRADIVVSCLPDTPATRGVFNASAFAAMKPSALFINVGRGSAVAEEDLAGALRRGLITAAALDVFCEEPLPPDNPLRFLENVLITPHSSGASEQNSDRNFELFYDLLKRYIAGKRLYNAVDFFAGY
ncbi:MAG: D-2-hydroxyacid dehydrogenase [Oscillospiraceae bacterium]|nr:D-2-hydroxyacid dehydrogenase [Oscillospiraceae bacterium]